MIPNKYSQKITNSLMKGLSIPQPQMHLSSIQASDGADYKMLVILEYGLGISYPGVEL
jgi:hypothetical protein